MKRIMLALGLMLASTPGITKEACVIIYASDMGKAVTKEIRDHEYAHCNGWEHPKGWETKTKAYRPSKSFLKDFKGKVYETPVSTFEARARCRGHLGCMEIIQE